MARCLLLAAIFSQLLQGNTEAIEQYTPVSMTEGEESRVLAGHRAVSVNIQSSRDLRDAITFQRSPQSGCIRLLNATHETGCASPALEAPILRYSTELPTSISGKSMQQLEFCHSIRNAASQLTNERRIACTDDRVLLLNGSHLAGVLSELSAQPNPHIKGVLVKPDIAGGANLDAVFPQAAFAPYQNRQHAWNPHGISLLDSRFDIPIQLLSDAASAEAALAKADANARQV